MKISDSRWWWYWCGFSLGWGIAKIDDNHTLERVIVETISLLISIGGYWAIWWLYTHVEVRRKA